MNHPIVLPNAPSIPLHCNICPKKPNFSDVSHLLTHIASKGHLSHYYKLKVRASTDPGSKKVVDEYDEWYDDWRVEDLMMERMNQKERKKNGSAANANASGNGNSGPSTRRASATNSAVTSSANTPVISNFATRRSLVRRESTLDPQLGLKIKTEPKSRSATPASAFALDAAQQNRSYAPPMQSWPTTPYGDSPVPQETSVGGSLYSTPTSDSGEVDSSRGSGIRAGQQNENETQGSLVTDNNAALDETTKDNAKLKGVLWDGMGMFDSATPDMRRKRNQKKSTSVVEFLQATSEVVEATELVFDAEGELRRERPITGNPESDDGRSPLKGESSPEPEFPLKKKATRRPRQALTEKNVNTGRPARRRGDSHHPSFNGRSRRTPYFDDMDYDDELTYGRPRPKRNGTLSIHRDSSGPEITFDHPAPFATLTAGFQNPLQSAGLQTNGQTDRHNDFPGRGHQRQPSFPYGPSFRPVNNNPLALPPPNFGSFGQLNSQTRFPNHGPFAFSDGHQGFPGFQQPFSVGPASFGNDIGEIHSQGQGPNHVQNHNPWDIFGFGPPDMGMPNGVDMGFHAPGDFTSANPLFFSSNQGGLEDDQATVSPPESDR